VSLSGLQPKDEAYVSVRINRHLALDILISTISRTEVSAEVWGDDYVDLVSVYEALKAATGAVAHELEKPRLKRLLEDRIAQLKRESGEAGEDYPPAPPTDDIPF
jgi:hypothetical protein